MRKSKCYQEPLEPGVPPMAAHLAESPCGSMGGQWVLNGTQEL